MREESGAKVSTYAGSLIFWEGGSMTARYGYDHAVQRLYDYESTGILPEDAGKAHRRDSWERYTVKAPDGKIFARRGWECVLGRLFSYECSGLTPEQWRERYGSGTQTGKQRKSDTR